MDRFRAVNLFAGSIPAPASSSHAGLLRNGDFLRRQPIFDWMGDVRLDARSILGKIDNRSARKARNEIRPPKLTSPAEPERCAVAFEEHPRRR